MEQPDSKYSSAIALEGTLPTLARSRNAQMHLKENWGAKKLKPILAMMRAGKLEGALGDEIHDFLDDLIRNEARTAWTGYLSGSEEYPIEIREFGRVYFVSAEGDDSGYFLDIEAARSFISFNWCGDVREEVQEDEDSDENEDIDSR
jgi:hypothetical protein